MPSDWVKMRTDLYRDPRVCDIADHLLDPEGPLARFVNQNCQRDMTVTRNVMRNVVVGALVSVWGVCRQRGKRKGDDLVIAGSCVGVIDDVADVPGFGDAMASVGWLKQGGNTLVFPRFFAEWNVEPDESYRQKNAERQRRFRERASEKRNAFRNVTDNVKSNDREEESINTPLTPLGGDGLRPREIAKQRRLAAAEERRNAERLKRLEDERRLREQAADPPKPAQ